MSLHVNAGDLDSLATVMRGLDTGDGEFNGYLTVSNYNDEDVTFAIGYDDNAGTHYVYVRDSVLTGGESATKKAR